MIIRSEDGARQTPSPSAVKVAYLPLTALGRKVRYRGEGKLLSVGRSRASRAKERRSAKEVEELGEQNSRA